MKTSLSVWAYIVFHVWEWVNACIALALVICISQIENLILSVVFYCISPLRMRSLMHCINFGQTSLRNWGPHSQCCHFLHVTFEKEVTHLQTWFWSDKFQRLKASLTVWAYIAFHVWEWVNACTVLALVIYISQIENLIFGVVVYCISPLRMRSRMHSINFGQTA